MCVCVRKSDGSCKEVAKKRETAGEKREQNGNLKKTHRRRSEAALRLSGGA